MEHTVCILALVFGMAVAWLCGYSIAERDEARRKRQRDGR